MRHLAPAIDIGSTTIRVVQIGIDAGSAVLLSWLEYRLPPDIIREGRVVDANAAREHIGQVFRQLGYHKRFGRLPLGRFRCTTSLPSHLGAVERTTLKDVDLHDRRRASRAAMFRAATFAKDPPLDDIDKCSVTVIPDMHAGDFIVFKSLREAVIERARLLQALGGMPAVEHAALSLCRAYPRAEAIIDVGARRSTLIVPMPDGIPQLRHYSFGAETLAERTRVGFSITREDAQRRIETEGVRDRSAIWSIDDFATSLTLDIKSLRNSHHNVAISSAVLVGDGSRVNGLIPAISAKASLRLAHEPLSVVQARGIPEAVFCDLAPSLALAVGSALGEVAGEERASTQPAPPQTDTADLLSA